MPRPRKQHKRPGERHQLNLTVHLATWLAFQQWCKAQGKVASEEIEEFMARTAASDPPTDITS
jgi:hypothetical protein